MAQANERRATMSNTDSGVDLVIVDYSSTDQTLAVYGRGLHCNVGGTLVIQTPKMLAEGAGRSATLVMSAGQPYPYDVAKIIRSGSSTWAGYVII